MLTKYSVLYIIYGPVVQIADNAIQWTNSYPVDNCSDNILSYPLEKDLSIGIMGYLLLEQWWPESDRELKHGKL